ncbi:MAG: response regulator [Bacteroidetes bacterium]|nr:response regulator [Bacteroidota bacterium]MCL5737991.1 response regulator [Bacteroidota bacterium]
MPKLVLLADDNADNILLIKRILKRSGLDIEIIDVQSGREVLKLAIERMPEVILLDMKMPDMDGYEAASMLKSSDATKHIPVIAVTAQAMIGDKEKAFQAGCNEYLTKPVDSALLIDTLKKYLSRPERFRDGILWSEE